MEKNNIQIHQAYYGEVDRGHDCINQTIEDSDLKSYLITYTDRPGALPPGVELIPYYSGSAYSRYYIFTKTFPDIHATRGGMVFTHVLIISIDDIIKLNNLDDLFSYFVNEVPIEREMLTPIAIEFSNIELLDNKFQPEFISKTVKGLIQGISPILITGDIKKFLATLQIIWNYPGIEFRKRIKFRASFTPNDITGKTDLTIVYIQNDFLLKWTDKHIISTSESKPVDMKANSELLFLGHTEGNPFHDFLLEMNVDLNLFSNFKSLEELFDATESLDNALDSNILRQKIRTLSIVSPDPNDGKKIKELFLKKLEQLFEHGHDSNAKALRNINWKAFENGETKVSRTVAGYLDKEILKIKNFQRDSIADLLHIAISEPTQNWWHQTVRKAFETYFKISTQTVKKNIWELTNLSDESLQDIFKLTPIDAEIFFVEQLPDTIKESTCNSVEKICRERKWFLLHAILLLKHLDGKQAIQTQLSFEKSLPFVDSIGVKYIAEKLSDRVIIDLAISTGDSKLMDLSKTRILKEEFGLSHLDVTNPNWLSLWFNILLITKDLSYGIQGKEKVIFYQVLDLLITNIQIPDIIFELASKTELCDISDYQNRQVIWQKILINYRNLFLNKTAEKVIDQFMAGTINFSSIEKPLLDVISSDRFITAFLSKNRSIIEPVIKIYETPLELKDRFLSDYIGNFYGNISDALSSRLGVIVHSRNYRLSANSIYSKSKYNKSFELAFQKCQNLIERSILDILFNSPNSKSHKETKYNMNLNNPISGIKELPTIVILTAISEEYEAVKKHLINPMDADKNDTSYESGIFEFEGQSIAKVIIRECGPKNTNASQETERAIQYFKPDCMFFVGIAGSRKPKDFSVGDVIFPEKIYSYEGGKSEKDCFKSRPDLAASTYALFEKAKKERRKNDWKVLIKNDLHKNVKANLGVIASGEQVIEHYESEIGKILTDHFNDTSAVEMEGFGFAKAAARQGRETSNMLIGIVRGISDIIGQHNEQTNNKNTDKRPDNVKAFASDTAAAFAYWLIYKTYGN